MKENEADAHHLHLMVESCQYSIIRQIEIALILESEICWEL